MLPEEQIYIENLLDRIATTIITDTTYTDGMTIDKDFLMKNQKTVKEGIIRHGRTDSEKLLLYQTDIEANAEDLIGVNDNFGSFLDICKQFMLAGFTVEQVNIAIKPIIDQPQIVMIELSAGNLFYDVTNLLSKTNDDGSRNPVNISQFIHIEKQTSVLNQLKAEEYLDTNIYELLSDMKLRQQRIDNAITEFKNLLPPKPTRGGQGHYPFDPNSDGSVNRDGENDPYPGEWYLSNNYYLDYSISAAQNNEDGAGEEEEGFIPRLQTEENSLNDGQSIQSLRAHLNDYLVDIDEEPKTPEDGRTVYSNKSEGYLKFRNLNQGIIIRNTNQDFIEGLNPETKEYLETGFTITMWVRFLDKTSEGTLFNFGNPTPKDEDDEGKGNHFGFKLETYVINKDDPISADSEFAESDISTYSELVNSINPNHEYLRENLNLFKNSDSERFVRLIVNESNFPDSIFFRDSSIGNPDLPLVHEWDGDIPLAYGNEKFNLPIDVMALNNKHIPSKLTEWYFICATYNPNIMESDSYNKVDGNESSYNANPYYWLNHIDPVNHTMITTSPFGKRCKVEIISRSDLLRARGYKV